MILTIDNITTWNGTRRNTYTFSIDAINESNFNEDEVLLMEYYLSDEKQIFADQLNIEYMGYLTGEVNCTKQELIDYLNEYFKTSHL